MNENLRKAFLLGLGALSYSEERYREFLNDLEIKGKANEQEADDFFHKVKDEFEENRKGFNNNVEKELKKLIKSMGLVTQEELKKEVSTLKKKVKKLENTNEQLQGEQK